MMFASKQGLLLVDPEVAPWTYQPRLAVTAVRVDGRSRPVTPRSGLTLTSEARGFSVEFAALDLSSPNANRYSPRLEGYDEHWTATTAARRVATYTNLDPGRYVLRVRGTNRVGRWSPDEIALPIIVEPGPLETVWFRGLVVIAVPCVLYLTHWWRIRRLRNREMELQQLVWQRTADLEEANRRLELSSRTDLLTGLPNRRGFAEVAEAEIRRWRRSKRPLCIALCDLGDLKAVNDTYGHDAGDHVLRSFATLIQEYLREADTAARWGGEEFILIFPETDLAGARSASEKLERVIAETDWRFQGQALKVTVTIGVAQLLDDAGLEDCITRADKALYEGKREGKSRVVAAG
jgi:diguanylate cyclase (GGDEF)-like protein